MADSLQLVLSRLVFDVDACASCDDNSALLLLVNQIIDSSTVVTDGASLTVEQWIATAPGNHFFKLNVRDGGDEQTVYVEPDVVPGIPEPVAPDCAKFEQCVLGGPPPRCALLESNVKVCLVVFDDPFTQAAATIVVRALPLAPPKVTMPPDLVGAGGLCALPTLNTTFPPLVGPTRALLDLGSGVATVEVTSACGTWLPSVGSLPDQLRDCNGATVTDRSKASCERWAVLLTIPADQDSCFPAANGGGQQLIDVVVGGPCFTCPADECDIESRNIKQALDAAAKRGIAAIKAAGVRNGCGRVLRANQFAISFRDKRAGDRCCRGEVVVQRTWTVRDTQCGVEASCVQRLRVFNPCWQKYFPSTCELSCDPEDRPKSAKSSGDSCGCT